MNGGARQPSPCAMCATLPPEFGRLRSSPRLRQPIVAFASTVTFRREDGRVQKYHIVGEDEADPKAGSISFVSPVARLLIGKSVGDVVGTSGQEIEIMAIS
jgi:transcription elongation GreA/GreB family factor